MLRDSVIKGTRGGGVEKGGEGGKEERERGIGGRGMFS